MRLIYVHIAGYKHLKDVSVHLSPPENTPLFQDEIPIRFFIGLNGSGKSVFLEGICFLFSLLSQDQAPGFSFSLIYEIQRNGQSYHVEVNSTPNRESFDIQVSTDGQKETEHLHSFACHRYLLPDYVFVCASGSTNNFYDIMERGPREALYNELFDTSMYGKTMENTSDRHRKAEQLLHSLRRLDESPICLCIDEQSAPLVLGSFLSVFPTCQDTEEANTSKEIRGNILSKLESLPLPVSFSLTVDEKRLSALTDESTEYGVLFQGLSAENGQDNRLCAWDTIRMYQDEVIDSADTQGDRVLTFLFDVPSSQDNTVPHVPSLTQAYQEPFQLLSALIRAKNKGLLKEAHISFRIRGSENLVEENALSEGEYMLLVRLGLLAMGRNGKDSCQCLYLLDEPDVYMNEHWNIDFVSTIHQIYQGIHPQHEIVVATHSSLILTDALPEQLYNFRLKDGQVQCLNIRAPTFGGNRNEIMEALFQTDRSVGSFSYQKIQQLFESSEDPDELESYVSMVGSGYLRLRLLDKIQRLRKQKG